MTITDAIKQLKTDTARSTFDQTVELHISLGTDPAKQDQNIRTVISLPHGTGKEKRVILINDEAQIAKIVAGELKPKVDFDAVVTTPDFMPKLARAAKILGPAGMMPNPKTGTVTTDPEKTIAEVKKGQIELRTEKGARNIHTVIGKLSFDETKLADNFKTVIDALNTARPAKLKGKYIKEITLKSTQSKGLPIDA